MRTIATGIDVQTLEDGFTFTEYVSALTAVTAASSDYTGLCVYKERPDPTMAPTTFAPTTLSGTRSPTTATPTIAPTAGPAEIIIQSAVSLSLDSEARENLNTEDTVENTAFRAGIVASISNLTSTDDVYGVYSYVTTRRRHLLADASTVEFNMVFEQDTNDAAVAAGRVASLTDDVQDDLIQNVASSSVFLDAMLNSLAIQGASNTSALAAATVDENATLTAIATATVGFVQTPVPTVSPSASPKKSSSSSSDSTTIIIIVVSVVGGVVLLGAAVAAAFFFSAKNQRVTPDGVVPGCK